MTIEHSKVSYGSKRISVAINTELHSASFRIGKREPSWLHPKLPNDTTIVFLEAEVIICQAVSRLQEPITLRLDTANSTMKAWIRNRKEFFGFDCVEPDESDAYRIFVTKTFYP